MDCIVPAKYDVTIWSGNTYRKRFKLYDKHTSEYISILGATINCKVYEIANPHPVNVVLEFEEGDGVVHVDEHTFELNKLVTLSRAQYYWELKITFTNGEVRSYWAGAFIVKSK